MKLSVIALDYDGTVAIGDAENDHELLRLAEVGVAVEWGRMAASSAASWTVTAAATERTAELG